MAKLYEMAKVLRSKNSGPFEITLDALFDDENMYNMVKNSGKITKAAIAKTYGIETDLVNEPIFFDAALGVKVTFAREISSGSCFERDVYGAQQHAPFMNIEI